ncbi:hypothetical protein ACHAPJ_011269 [Fusarium lateritium]
MSPQSHFAMVDYGENCIRCCSCTHTMPTCIEAVEGEVIGCPLCDSKTHLVDDCKIFKQMSLKEKFDVLVVSRANMAPFKTKSSWYFHLWNYLNSDESEGEPLPTAFPWSKEFAKAQSLDKRRNTIREIQKEFDATGDEKLLPVDPSTSSMEAIYKTFPELQDLPWPARLNGVLSEL